MLLCICNNIFTSIIWLIITVMEEGVTFLLIFMKSIAMAVRTDLLTVIRKCTHTFTVITQRMLPLLVMVRFQAYAHIYIH